MGRAMVGITAIFAELESDVISERSKAMHQHLKEQGRWVGRVPFGWRLEDGRLLPNDDEQAVLAGAARRYVSGESMRSIAPDVGISHPNLSRMLRSDRVIDALPPALSGALVRNLAQRGREGTRAKRTLLGGIARCGIWGRNRRQNGDGSQGSYACREQGHVSISRGFLDRHATEAILDAIDTGRLVKRIEKRARRGDHRGASQEIEARLELLERDHYERGMIARESYLRRREGLLRRLKEAREAAEDAGIDLPRELARDLGKTWPRLTVHERRRIIAAVLQRVEVSKAEGHGKINPGRVRLVWRG
jgi:site-specific DNA recombinase